MGISSYLRDVSTSAGERIKDLEVTDKSYIPTAADAKLEVNRWYRVDEAVAVYADMKDSTALSSTSNAKTVAKAYELFTGSWIALLQAFRADYIDIKGDGGFGLFYGKSGTVQAMLAAITFRTLVERHLRAKANAFVSKEDWSMEAKVGIHRGSLLVKKVGSRNVGGTQNNWLVWAGKPVNYASKLSGYAGAGELLVTSRVRNTVENPDVLHEHLILSCGCSDGTTDGPNVDLWEELPEDAPVVSAVPPFEVYRLSANWCSTHGDEYFDAVKEYLENSGVEIAAG